MITELEVVDAATGSKPSNKQVIIRYLSAIFFIGFLWVLFDKSKQGRHWHDKLAATVLIKTETSFKGLVDN